MGKTELYKRIKFLRIFSVSDDDDDDSDFFFSFFFCPPTCVGHGNQKMECACQLRICMIIRSLSPAMAEWPNFCNLCGTGGPSGPHCNISPTE